VNNFPTLKGLQVIVVDDDADNLELTAIILESYEAQVMKAASASEAFELIRQSLPEVLIVDIAMPGEDGYSLIRRIRQSMQIPAIALTALAMEENRIRALESGFQLYLTKPVEPSELVTAIAKLVRGYQ
jgi:CheY-like chemotaxis protein